MISPESGKSPAKARPSARDQEEFEGPDSGESSAALTMGAILFLRRKWIVLLWITAFVGSGIIAFMIPKRYKSQATFQINTHNSFKLSLPEGLKMLDPKLGSSGGGMGAILQVLDSRKLAITMIDKFDLRIKYKTKWDHLAIKKFRKSFEYEVFDDGVVQASLEYSSRDSVQIILDSLLAYLDRESVKFSTSKARMEFEFNKGLVDSVYAHLDSLSLEWIRYMTRNRMADLEKNVELSMRSYGKIEESLVQLEGEYAQARIDNNKSPQERENIRVLIAMLKVKKKDLLGGKRSSNGKDGFELAINYDSIPTMSAHLEKINLLVEKDKIILRALLPKLEDSRIRMVETTPIVNMIDPSYKPQYKSGPKRIFIIIFGTIIVGFLGTVLIVLREFFLNPAFRPRNLDSLLMHVRSYR